MAIQESGEMYLETILILSQRSACVRSVDVAEYMNFSKPSISRAMGILKSDGYITVAEDGGIVLTETGRTLAEKIYSRHQLLAQALMRLGVDEATAVADACKIEHDISDASIAAIQRHLESVG